LWSRNREAAHWRKSGKAWANHEDPRLDAEKVEELLIWAVAHKPSPRKLQLALEHLAAHPKDKKAAYENILWALINTKEFLFNQ
jgi:hypothetical protein